MSRCGLLHALPAVLLCCATFLSGADAWFFKSGYTITASSPFPTLQGVQKADGCWRQCKQTRGCKSVVYNSKTRRCWRKTAQSHTAVPSKDKFLSVVFHGKPPRQAQFPDPPAPTPQKDPFVVEFFVHLPYAFGGQRMKMDIYQVGNHIRSIQHCQKICHDAFGNECLYAQWKEGFQCYISKSCSGNKCLYAKNINAAGRDFNRVNCMNKQFRNDWKKMKVSAKLKGPTPCSNIDDEGNLLFTVNNKGKRSK